MTSASHVLTPEALAMMDAIARTGSFAGAARELGKVPSALTYNVRQLEEALDVLLFDRRSRQAKLTAAGTELLDEGRRLLVQMDAVANRVKRVASGWESQLCVAVDGAISASTVFELCEAFYALQPHGAEAGPGTRLRLRGETLAGTWEALISGVADLAIGVTMDQAPPAGIQMQVLGTLPFVFAVAPWHALASADSPLTDAELIGHRAVAVADSAQRLAPVTVNLLPGQDVLTVPTMAAKIEALLRGIGCGFVPEPMVRPCIENGHLVVKAVERPGLNARMGYAWRDAAERGGARKSLPQGLALRWWLSQLDSTATRKALLTRHDDRLMAARTP